MRYVFAATIAIASLTSAFAAPPPDRSQEIGAETDRYWSPQNRVDPEARRNGLPKVKAFGASPESFTPNPVNPPNGRAVPPSDQADALDKKLTACLRDRRDSSYKLFGPSDRIKATAFLLAHCSTVAEEWEASCRRNGSADKECHFKSALVAMAILREGGY